MIRILRLVILAAFLGGCSYIPSLDKVLPDTRSDYKKSEPLPDLEVPPDLTAGATTDAMTIPGEGASLSRYEQQRRAGQRASGSAPVSSSTEGDSISGEQWVSVSGTKADIWPKLETFIHDSGYDFEVNDAELGVMETTWSEPVNDGGETYRDKYKLFTEPGEKPGATVLFISNERQRRSGEDNAADWTDTGGSNQAERFLAAELNKYFNGSSSTRVAAATPSGGASTSGMTERALAQLEDAGDDKIILALPEEFTRAWRSTETVLERAGFSIIERDQGNGMYYINYYDRSADKKKGWLSKLAFWRDDEPEAIPYVLSLTGSGNRTEVIVLDEQGDWQNGEDAGRILRIIRNEYNRL